MRHPRSLAGYVACLASATGFGLMAVFAKLAYRGGVDVSALLLVRFTLAALVLLTLAASTGALRALGPRRALATLGMGAVGYAAQAGLYFSALTLTDAARVSLAFCTYPLIVMAATAATGRDALSTRGVLAAVAAIAGLALVLGRHAAGPDGSVGSVGGLGVVLALGSAVVYTGYILVGDRLLEDAPPLGVAALVCGGASTTFLLVDLARGGPDLGFEPSAWVWLALLALVGTVTAVVLFFRGLAILGPSRASLLSIVEPVVTVTSAAVVFGETLSGVQVAGGLLVLAAVAVGRRARTEQTTTSAASP